ncbi:hypothetical protein WICMUC_005806 [Wickerhamomyces mucosus]|uniref:RING-type E3 ubiquitin transferase n=1 Tax=Wickerhamomyces mucosus TaxID=1378264 RepID=A0A9P8P3K7_9ASCO|nr:hypothetical protein WICMUC_005806 [Wickerhamomyces mucosus]
MDEIRAKRLAKLGAVASQSSTPPSSSNTHPLPSTSKLDSQAVPPPEPHKIQIPVEESQFKTKPKGASTKTLEDVFNKWITIEFENILGVTLNHENEDPNLVFLESTFTELVEENQDPFFNRELIDRSIIEKLSEIGVDNPFQFLKDSWNKTNQSRRLILQKDPLRQEKLDVLDEIERLTSSYGLVSFEIPDMFLNGNITRFLHNIIDNQGSYADFLVEIINRSHEQDTLLEFLDILIPNLIPIISNIDLNSRQYSLILNIFQLLLNNKAVASVFTKVNGFKILNPDELPSTFENSTILGHLFRLSPLQDTVSCQQFNRSVEKDKLNIKRIGESLQAEHKVVLDRLFFIANKIIRGSEQSRNDLLSYFATIVNKNHLRRGDHSDFSKLSSNAFITNISLVLIRLCQPFLDSSYSKIDRIDIGYFQKNSIIDLREETRTNSTTVEADKYFQDNKLNESANFISDCFFLTLAYLHYGIGGDYLFENKLKQNINRLEASVEELKQSSNNPNMMQRFAQLQLPKLEKKLADLKSIKDSLVSFFIHRDLQLEIFEFVTGASCFLIRAIDPAHQFPRTDLKLPLIPDVIGVENADNTEYFRSKAPIPFKYYPEYIIEGIVNYVQYVSRYVGNPLILNPRLQTFVEFAVTFLRCPELVGNPHLKGKLVEALFFGSLESQDNRPGFMMDIFETNDLVSNNLLYSLLDFYVIVEKTGSSSQFYDKFNSRYHISSILEQIWKTPLYKNQLIYQSENNEEFFIRFVARMLNDLTFLLDESLTQLSEVHIVQNELEFRAKGVTNLEGTDEELQKRLSSAESQAKSYVGLANKSIDLFGLFTKDISKAFIKPEIIGRLASMLDYNLDALVGPKCSDLKVKNPEKYQFKPRELLVNIAKIYVNLSNEPEFIKSVSEDTRSFKMTNFKRAQDILSRWSLASPDFLNLFMKFAIDADNKRIEQEEEEQELGEVPDEFLDPLMFTLMKDPVILPSSKVSIDRATIKAHLLSDSTDPFNRMPLKLEDVVDDYELKARIGEWKQSVRK